MTVVWWIGGTSLIIVTKLHGIQCTLHLAQGSVIELPILCMKEFSFCSYIPVYHETIKCIGDTQYCETWSC